MQHRLRIALWALLLLAGHSLQVVAATHWHGNAHAAADAAVSQPPATDLAGHEGCLLCQAAAHAGDDAPPPAPWVLHDVHETRAQILRSSRAIASVRRPSHAWQGRAPPRI